MSQTTNKTSFTIASIFEKQDYERLIRLRNDPEYRTQSPKHLIPFRRHLDGAINALLNHALTCGHISKIVGSKNHRIPIVTEWNKMAQPHGNHETPCVMMACKIGTRLLSKADCQLPGDKYPTPSVSNSIDYDVTDDDYQCFVDRMNRGDLLEISRDPKARHDSCQIDGQTYYLQIRNWKAEAKRFEPSLGDYVAIEPLPAPKLHHLDISFKSGDLIVFDPLDMNSFNGFKKLIEYHNGTASGFLPEQRQIERTGKLWTKFRIIELRQEMSTNIYKNIDADPAERIIAARLDWRFENQPPEKLSIAANVCSETTLYIVEREYLALAMASRNKSGEIVNPTAKLRADASEKISLLIKFKEISTLQIKPGSYHLYFTPNRNDANKLFRKHQPHIDPALLIDFLITKEPIDAGELI